MHCAAHLLLNCTWLKLFQTPSPHASRQCAFFFEHVPRLYRWRCVRLEPVRVCRHPPGAPPSSIVAKVSARVGCVVVCAARGAAAPPLPGHLPSACPGRRSFRDALATPTPRRRRRTPVQSPCYLPKRTLFMKHPTRAVWVRVCACMYMCASVGLFCQRLNEALRRQGAVFSSLVGALLDEDALGAVLLRDGDRWRGGACLPKPPSPGLCDCPATGSAPARPLACSAWRAVCGYL